MTKKSLDEKYSYQIDEHNVVHLFRGEEDCQQLLTNPLLSAIFKIESLEKEHTELKCECRRCIHTDCPCVLSDYGKDRNGICDHFKDVFDENVELKEKQKWLGSSTKCWFSNSPCRSCDEHDERLRRLGLCYVAQLTEAKEKISKLLEIIKRPYQFNALRKIQLVNEAVQFLKEVEK